MNKEMRMERRWFWAWDLEKEEKWLNEMAAAGWALSGVSLGTYRFEKCEPSEYTVRFALSDAIAPGATEGAEYVGSVLRWVYYRKQGELDLMPSAEAKANQLSKLSALFIMLLIMNTGIGISNTISAPHIGWLNLIVAMVLAYGAGRLHGMKEAIKKG